MFADVMAQLTALTQTVSKVCEDQQIDHKRLTKLETSQEPLKMKEPLVLPNGNRNTPNHDDQYRKSIKECAFEWKSRSTNFPKLATTTQ